MVDFPRHRDLFPDMIVGAVLAETCVSDDGQGPERALLRAMVVPRLVVAMNRLVTTEFSIDRCDDVIKAVGRVLTGWRVCDIVLLQLSK